MNNWRKRHHVDSLLPFPLRVRQRRSHPHPPGVNSTYLDMGNFLSGLPCCTPKESGSLGLLKGWVCALRDSRDLTVVTSDYVESGRLLQRQRVEDSRNVALKASPFPRGETTPFWKKAYEKTAECDKRLREIEAEVKQLYEERQQRKPAEDLSDLFIPLTVEEENVVHDCLYSIGPSSEVLVLHESSNIEVSREKFWCLRPDGWLNDEVINLYLELLKEREVREPKRFLKCHFFNTFFYKKLACGKNGYDYKSVKRWTTRRKLGYDLNDCDKIFVPVHKYRHWCLAIINMKEKTFQYLDSLDGMDHNVLRILALYIAEELKDKSNTEVNTSSWRKESVDSIPLQKNGSDCGMFMLKYIDFHSRGLSLSFSQENMEYFRKRVANEIIRLRAD